jgi:hypothetical protein
MKLLFTAIFALLSALPAYGLRKVTSLERDLHETLAESAPPAGLETAVGEADLDSQSLLRHCRKLVSFFGEQVL